VNLTEERYRALDLTLGLAENSILEWSDMKRKTGPLDSTENNSRGFKEDRGCAALDEAFLRHEVVWWTQPRTPWDSASSVKWI
jgi:hypothetical protein